MAASDARQALFDALECAARDGVFPGCVAWVHKAGSTPYHEAHGVLATHPDSGRALRAPVMRETIYDLASLTKVLSTTTLIAQEVAAGRVDLEAPLPAPFDRACPDARIIDLLEHRAGLEAHREFFRGRAPGEVEALMADLLGTPRRGSPRDETLYSDLGFILLGAWLERELGAPLDTLFEQRVARPQYLDLSHDRRQGGRFSQLAYRRISREAWLAAEFETQLAPTEVYDAGLHAEAVPSHFEIRAEEKLAHGRVHDDNCVVLDGVAGHAGLFGHAEAVGTIARAWLAGEGLGIDAATRDLFWRPRESRVRRVGWDGQCPDGSGSTGGALGPRAVGHLGFTGTSLWIDPDAEAIYVLLSNRVHPTREGDAIKALRRDFHRLAAAL